MLDQTKVCSESIRWMIMLALYSARPLGAYEELALHIIQVMCADTTAPEVRRELKYLANRKLVELRKEPSGRWFANISREGIDVVEYAVDCDSGIARPVPYWNVDNAREKGELSAIA